MALQQFMMKVMPKLPAPVLKKILKKRVEGIALSTFQRAATEIPAYREFLKSEGVDPDVLRKKVRTIQDFEKLVPITTPDNYVKRFPWWQRVPESMEPRLYMLSSGSTGEPKIFPYDIGFLDQASYVFAQIIRNFFRLGNQRFLLVNTFYMGMPGAGVSMQQALALTQKLNPDLKFATISPGVDVDVCLQVLDFLKDRYEAWLLFGYPEVIEEVVSNLERKGYKLPSVVHIFTAGEAITQAWRESMEKRCKGKVFSGYGAIDAGILGVENDLMILARRLAHEDPKLSEIFAPKDPDSPLYGKGLPGFFQTPPTLYLEGEEETGRLLITSLPLVRYRIGDLGVVRTLDWLLKTYAEHGYDLLKIGKERRFPKPLPLPVVILYTREGEMITITGLNVHIKTLREIFNNDEYGLSSLIADFSASSTESEVAVKISLRGGLEPSPDLAKEIREKIIQGLLKLPEFRALYKKRGDDIPLVVKLYRRDDPDGPWAKGAGGVKPKAIQRA